MQAAVQAAPAGCAAGGTLPFSFPAARRPRLCHFPPRSFGVLLAFLLTRQLSERRGKWRLPRAPEECPQVCDAMLLSVSNALLNTGEGVWRPRCRQHLDSKLLNQHEMQQVGNEGAPPIVSLPVRS